MKNAASSRITVRNNERSTKQRGSAGPEGVAVAPPAYGIDTIDNEIVALGPDQVQEPQSLESTTWSGGAAIQRKSVESGASNHAFGKRRENKTGLPDRLKTGIEHLSGYSMDDVRGHYNSAKPAQLQPFGEYADRPTIQPKLTVGPVSDKYEVEADRVAKQVMTMPAPVQGERARTLQKKPFIQRAGEGSFEVDGDFESRLSRSKGGGMPLPDTLRANFEPKFGADFSGVWVHTDAQSDQLNQSIQAKAFTTGQDVFFRQGAYQPGSRGGQELIAHELTHVVQQGGSKANKVQTKLTVGPAGEKYEQEADAVAAQVFSMDKQPMAHELKQRDAKPINTVNRMTAPAIQRKTADLPILEDTTIKKKWGGMRQSKTQEIQSLILRYNGIPVKDVNYEIQKTLLKKIVKKGNVWLDNAGSSRIEERSMDVEHVVYAAERQLSIVSAQDVFWRTEVKDLPKVGISNFDAKVDAAADLPGIGIGSSQAVTLDQETKDAGNDLNKGAHKFFEESEGLREKAETEINEGDILSHKGQWERLQNGVKGFVAYLKEYAVFQGAALILSFVNLMTAINDNKAFQKAKKSLPVEEQEYTSRVEEQEYTSRVEEQEYTSRVEEPTQEGGAGESISENIFGPIWHGAAKVKRRLWSAVYDFASAILGLINFFVATFGGPWGAAFAATSTIGKNLLGGIFRLGRMLKGLYKIITKTRGKNRKKSAETIVTEARKGDRVALQLLVDLKPIGGKNKKIAEVEARLLDKTLWEVVKLGLEDPENITDMKSFLDTLSRGEFGPVFTMENYMELTVAKWKSQA